jgi:hypothetical protein
MKTVNLLPAWYLKQRRRQRHLHVHAAAMVVIGAAMIGVVCVGRQRLAALGQQRDRLAARLSQVSDPEPELRREKADLKRLQELRLARQELGPTVPMSAVLQQLQNDMTPGMALSNVNIDVRSDPLKGSGVVGDIQAPPRYHNVAHICVVGVAPAEKKITDLVQDISKNPLFNNVTLDYIRSGTLQGYSVRRFEIQLCMELDRLPTEAVEAPTAARPSAVDPPLASGDTPHGE